MAVTIGDVLALEGHQVSVRFTKSNGRKRTEHGTLRWEEEQQRVRIVKSSPDDFRLVPLCHILSLSVRQEIA